MSSKISVNCLEKLKDGDKTYLINYLKCSIQNISIKKFDKGDERPCESSDFLTEKVENEEALSELKLTIVDLINSGFFSTNETSICPDVDSELLALIIITCGENVQIKQWNTEKSVKTCSEILNLILKLFGNQNLFQIIFKKNLLKIILQNISQKLLPQTWKHYPATLLCYKWILEMITQPDLVTYLQFILPPALLLVDDFVNENKIIGVECLNHIINNITVAEIQFYGYGDVVYNALMPLLHIREADLISCAVPCLVTLTTKLETDFRGKNITKWSRFDEILSIYLENMEFEQIISLRNAYIKNLKPLINAAGIHIIRWSKRLLRIFREYLQISAKYNDHAIMNFSLKVVHKYLEISKPMIQLHAKSLIALLCIPLHCILTGRNNSAETKELTCSSIKFVLESISENGKKEIQLELEKKLKKDNLGSLYQNICNLIEDK